ncbi:MAG: Rieske (2Fe-2S) protein [Ferruginibacter sp.]|nr:Rieske (2Fe-2S) protein [Ferruginibacter sp.]
MNRKEFLRYGCNTCLMGALAMLAPALPGCSPAYSVFKTEAHDNQLNVPLTMFEKTNTLFVRPKGWQYDIAVHKNEDGQYLALLLQCTHMDNQLTPSQNGYLCSLHGSRFNSQGEVLKGPAETNLKKYTTTINNHNLIISI